MSTIRRRRKQFFAAVLMWGFLLLFSSLQPHWLMKKLLPYEVLHPAAHAVFYGLFAWFLCFWLRFQRSLASLRMTARRIAVISLLMTAAWGGMAELLQHLRADRYAAWDDWFCNMIGAGAGVAIFFLKVGLRRSSLGTR